MNLQEIFQDGGICLEISTFLLTFCSLPLRFLRLHLDRVSLCLPCKHLNDKTRVQPGRRNPLRVYTLRKGEAATAAVAGCTPAGRQYFSTECSQALWSPASQCTEFTWTHHFLWARSCWFGPTPYVCFQTAETDLNQSYLELYMHSW